MNRNVNDSLIQSLMQPRLMQPLTQEESAAICGGNTTSLGQLLVGMPGFNMQLPRETTTTSAPTNNGIEAITALATAAGSPPSKGRFDFLNGNMTVAGGIEMSNQVLTIAGFKIPLNWRS